MLSVGQLFVLSLVLFLVYALFVRYEERRGERVFLSKGRAWLDSIVVRITTAISSKLLYLGRHIIKLSWYYGIHKILKVILTALVKAYDFLEAIFMRNRDRARTLKVEKRSINQNQGHFEQVAEHKASTALTETQKKKLLQKKLERG